MKFFLWDIESIKEILSSYAGLFATVALQVLHQAPGKMPLKAFLTLTFIQNGENLKTKLQMFPKGLFNSIELHDMT